MMPAFRLVVMIIIVGVLTALLTSLHLVHHKSNAYIKLSSVSDDGFMRRAQSTTVHSSQQDINHPQATPAIETDVWWFAPFLDHSSFGVEACSFVLPLLKQRLILDGLLRVGWLQDKCGDQQAGTMDLNEHAQLLRLHTTPYRPAIVVCHNLPAYMGRPLPRWRSCEPCPPPHQPGRVRYAVARAMAETDRIPRDFVAALNSMDELWVPTEASASVLRTSGVVRPLRLVPLPVDTQELDPQRVAPLPLPPPQSVQVFGPRTDHPPSFVFVSVFKWELRKSYDVLLKAFLQEFSQQQHVPSSRYRGASEDSDQTMTKRTAAKEQLAESSAGSVGRSSPLGSVGSGRGDVALYILTKPFLSGGLNATIPERLQRWAHDVLGGLPPADQTPHVYVISEHMGRSDYHRLLAAADAFVLPTRGEGWGLPIVEAMSMGLPVIATNWSGPTAYLDEQVGYPLPYSLTSVPSTEPYWFQGSRWAEPSLPDLRRVMRAMVSDSRVRVEAKRRGAAARRRMQERYSPTLVAHTVAAELRRIEQQTKNTQGARVGSTNGT